MLIFIAIASPSLFFGALQVIFYIVAGIVILLMILSLIFRAKIRRMQREMEERMGQGTGHSQGSSQTYGSFFGGQSRSRNQSDDDVKVYKQSGTGEKKISEDVGDYVDFEEVKEK
ncbi:MAG: DUF4834 family protein [Rikenellaceae bacterium]